MNSLPQRKSIRLKSFDYSQSGAYFVTICTHNRRNLLASVYSVGANLCVRPNDAGLMMKEKLLEIENKYADARIDYYCVMPNHIHFILFKQTQPGAHTGAPLREDETHHKLPHSKSTLPEIVKWFKTQTTNEYIKMVKQGKLLPFDEHVWQRNYYEHVIRNENDLYDIRKYIEENPLKWVFDKYYGE